MISVRLRERAGIARSLARAVARRSAAMAAARSARRTPTISPEIWHVRPRAQLTAADPASVAPSLRQP